MNEIFDKQKQLLQMLQDKHPSYLQPSTQSFASNKEVVSYIKDMQYFLNIEIQELILAIGNNDSSIFKPWKAYHDTISSFVFKTNDLVKREAIDVLCFAVDICLAVGVSSTEVDEIYNNVNANNIHRQDGDY